MGNFLPEKKKLNAGEKIRKNDFAPSEKYSCYAPAFIGLLLFDKLIDHLSCTVHSFIFSNWHREWTLCTVYAQGVFYFRTGR